MCFRSSGSFGVEVAGVLWFGCEALGILGFRVFGIFRFSGS